MSVLADPVYQTEFTFTDEHGTEVTMPLRELEPVECL
jgi:effector-binding domain-containing protein